MILALLEGPVMTSSETVTLPIFLNASRQLVSYSSIFQGTNCKVKYGRIKLQGFANLCSIRLGEYICEWILEVLAQRVRCIILDQAESFEIGSLTRFWINCGGLSSWEYF